jgi:hypothetical protein
VSVIREEPPPSYTAFGRCKSGKRWFWIAAEMWADHKCDDPVCVYGGPHECGWEDTEELAIKAMSEAIVRLGGQPCSGHGNVGTAADALKRLNAAKRAARPPSKGKNTGGR